MTFSFLLSLSLHRWRWPSLPTPVLVMMIIMTFPRLSCSTKSCPQTPPLRLTFLNPPKGLISRRLLAGDSSQECTSAQSVINASNITQCLLNTRECTAGCSLTTALSVEGLSEQPPCSRVTGSGNAKTLPICVLNVGTVFQPHWTNSDTTAQSVVVTMTADTVERVFRSLAA